MNVSLHHLAGFLPGSVMVGEPGTLVQRVHTDTRTLQPGDLFVALKGERFDGNDLLPQAQAAGAAAVLAQSGRIPKGMSGLEVPDTLAALGQLAQGWRGQFSRPVIAVVGSNGKTTVTQMIAAILRAWHGPAALATQGNLNNHIGVPLTLLRMTAQHRASVVELGINHPGETKALAALVQPTVVLINNAQREHQEFMVDLDAVVREHADAIASLPPGQGCLVMPAHESYSAHWLACAARQRVLTFALAAAPADIYGTALWHGDGWDLSAHTPAGPVQARLRVAGLHNVKNALAAIAAAVAIGAPVAAMAAGLSQFEPVTGRSQLHALHVAGHALTLVNDSYNANPDSVRAAIDVLADLPGPHLLVLGDMGEVGTQGPQFHREVGDYARSRGISRLYTVGALSGAAGGQHFETVPALSAAVCAALPQLGTVLVKGSRFMRMERVVQTVLEQVQTHKEGAHAA